MYPHISAGRRWRKSRHSGGSTTNCVEVGFGRDGIAVRDSKNPDGPVLSFPAATFTAFLTATKHGHLDR